MFRKGDKVIYPHHGAAVIEDLTEREFLGEKKKYFVLRLAYGDLTLMVPVDSTEEVGLREVVSKRDVKKVLDVLRKRESRMPTNWSRRYKTNIEKIRSGDVYQVAEVVRNLAIRESEKGLSTGEKQMYTRAKKILASELMYALDKEEEDAEEYLESCISDAHAERNGKPAAAG